MKFELLLIHRANSLFSTNDLVALSENTFYITNFFYYRNNLPEALLRLKWGSVVYYDGQQGHTVLTGLDGPNGINKLDKSVPLEDITFVLLFTLII